MSKRLAAAMGLFLVTGAWGSETTRYDAWLDSPGGKLSFDLTLRQEGEAWAATICNGSQCFDVPRVAVEDNDVVLTIDYYDSEIRAKRNADTGSLSGEWRKQGRGRVVSMPFRAVRTEGDTRAEEKGGYAEAFSGRWSARFSQGEEPVVGVFRAGPDGTSIEGTFLTTTGDYGYIAGHVHGNRLTLSCFDGGHAFLFEATLRDDGTLEGDFWSGDKWHETWTATRDPGARLPSGFEKGQYAVKANLGSLVFSDLNGKSTPLATEAEGGKALILQVFGTWCPNCHDETRYLVELDQKYRAKGLRIIGLAFELSGEQQRDARQVRTFMKHHSVRYPMLLAGRAEPDAVASKLPFLKDFKAYPTSVFLDAEGTVRAVHSGFSGPATGEEYEALKRSFEDLVKELLNR
jgi:thiol-disulfide isomerase/thioredoxin